MKVKKTILGLVCLSAVFATLAGCGSKKNKSVKVTTQSQSTPANNTPADNTPAVVINYEVSKDIFDSYFKTDTSAKVLASNYELNVTDVIENNEIASTRKIDNGKAIIDDSLNHMYVDITDDEFGNLELDAYDYDSDDEKWSNLAVLDYDVDVFANKYLLPILDYTKLTYNATTHKYSSSEEITFEDDNIYGGKTTFTYTNIEISFENNKLKSISFSINEKEYDDENNLNEYDYTRTMVIKDKGSTSVESPVRNMVNESTFISFLGGLNIDILNGLNYTAHYSFEYKVGETGGAQADIKADNGLFSLEYQQNGGDKIYYFYDTEDGPNYEDVTYNQYRSYDGNNWDDIPQINSSVNGFLSKRIHLVSLDYDDLTYNYETKMYEADSIDMGNMILFKNVKVKFEDKKLVSISYTEEVYDSDDELVRSRDIVETFTNIGTTEVVSPFKYMVDVDTFNEYFGVQDMDGINALNYTVDYTYSGTYNGSKTVKTDEGCFLVTSSNEEEYYKTEEGTASGTISYDKYTLDGTDWIKTSETDYNLAAFLNGVAYLPSYPTKFDFDSFAYNKDTLMYEAEEIVISSNRKFENVKIKFEDGKLVSLSYTDNTYSGSSAIVSLDIEELFTNVGKTEVENPASKGYEELFSTYFGIDTFDELEAANYTLVITKTDSDNNTKTRTRKVKGNEILDSGTDTHGSTSYSYEDYYLIEKIDDTHYSFEVAYKNNNGDEFDGPYNGGSSSALSGIVGYFYLPNLDYSKVSFDDTEQAFVSTESVTYSIIIYEDIDITYTDTISNIKIVFEGDILKTVSYHLRHLEEFEDWDYDEELQEDILVSYSKTYDYTVSIDVSEAGTTDFETPELDD